MFSLRRSSSGRGRSTRLAKLTNQLACEVRIGRAPARHPLFFGVEIGEKRIALLDEREPPLGFDSLGQQLGSAAWVSSLGQQPDVFGWETSDVDRRHGIDGHKRPEAEAVLDNVVPESPA